MKLLIIFAGFLAIASAANIGTTIPFGECIGWARPFTHMISARGCFRQEVLRSGNAVIRRQWDGFQVWHTATDGRGGYNFCLSHADGKKLALFQKKFFSS